LLRNSYQNQKISQNQNAEREVYAPPEIKVQNETVLNQSNTKHVESIVTPYTKEILATDLDSHQNLQPN
jgi:hypothetical protein